MASGFSTQAVNFIDALSSDVDPRTGQFNFSLSLATLSSNRHLGPIANLSLSYSPLNDGDMGFGERISLNISKFDSTTNTLSLRTGETYKVTSGTVQIKNRKSLGFTFEFIRPGTASLGYRITWKDGTKEELTSPFSNSQFVTQKVESPLGRTMTFNWLLNSGKTYLRSIQDEFNTLLNVTYGSSLVTVTQYPGTDEAVVTSLYMQNSNQLSRITRQVSATETLTWLFEYTLTGPSSTSALTKVTYPTRLIEQVTYSTNSGNSLMYPPASGLGWLPVVTTHTKAPGFGQPAITANWKFDAEGSKNFLGYTGNFGTWTADSDYTYSSLLSTYIYGSIVTIGSGSNTETTTYRYNNYHLQISEDRRSGTTRYLTETEYYALVNTAFENQPLNFQLPKKVTKTWSDTSLPAGQQTRSETTLTEFDIYGNPTREQTPDGTVTETVWYAATGETGCPADPNGFVRFMKSQTVTPAKTEFDAPVVQTIQRYAYLGNTSSVVLTEQEMYSDNIHNSTVTYNYNATLGSAEFGRLVKRTDIIFDPENSADSYTSTLDITTTINASLLTHTTSYKGYDNLTTESSLTLSTLNGLTYSEISAQGVRTDFRYDLAGRITRRTEAAGSNYENITNWEYAVTDNGLDTTETQQTGVAIRTRYDGLGRQIKLEQYDPDTTKVWYTISNSSWNSMGKLSAKSGGDHLLSTTGNATTTISLSNTTDGWGNINQSVFNDGTTSQGEQSPVTLTGTMQLHGGSGSSILRSFISRTRTDSNGLPLEMTALDSGENKISTVSYQRDGLGRVRRHTDAEGNVTVLIWDIYNRELSRTLSDGTVITRRYAPGLKGDFPISISVRGKNSDGVITNWILGTRTWDSLGRLTSETVGGRTTQYRYTGSAEAPAEVIPPTGIALNCTYIPELGDAISSMKSGTLNQSFSYDTKNGQLLNSTDSSGTSFTRTYFPSGKLKNELSTGTDKKAISYSRTASLLGVTVTEKSFSGNEQQYKHDTYGRITEIEDSAVIISFEYDALTRPYRTVTRDKLSNDTLTTELKYDDFGREIDRTITDSRGNTLNQRMSRRKDGRMIERETHLNGFVSCNESFKYDERNRLSNWSATGSTLPQDSYGHTLRSQTFSHDALNNITQVVNILADGSTDTVHFEYANKSDPTQLTALAHSHSGYPARISLEYDANGRLIRDENGHVRSYDVTGRLTELADNNKAMSKWRYDALGRISEQDFGGKTNGYYYDSGILTTEREQGSEIFTRRIHTGGLTQATVSGGQITLCGVSKGGSLLWSRVAGNSTGQQHTWSVYGQGNTTGLLPGFNGVRLDPASRNYALGNGYRNYSPELMRFTAPDNLSPFGAGGINPYCYCDGDPANLNDPSGHLSWQAWLGIGLGIAGLALTAVTGGLSIVAAGSLAAAWSSASTATLVIGGIGVAADLLGILSGALEDAAPSASFGLGIASMALGVVGLGASITSAAKELPSSVKALRSGGAAVNPAAERTALAVAGFPESAGVFRRVSGTERLYASSFPTQGSHLIDAITAIQHTSPDARITIVSGTHGTRTGEIWRYRASGVRVNGRFRSRSLLSTDVEIAARFNNVSVSDLGSMTGQEFTRTLKSDEYVILSYCYSRNDEVLRGILNLDSVTTTPNAPVEFFWRLSESVDWLQRTGINTTTV